MSGEGKPKVDFSQPTKWELQAQETEANEATAKAQAANIYKKRK
jgi:hypothetical protein